ncbi:hypothetical protein RRV45_03555 [Bacillus sp. DTU_2020_1000418_1_SI_GHA_SEK_038]|uniref:hypothetical protein n=1 Tax=Bacillus sp. DTU_2020_1000418_1_SI_GHA_SEK_038 TaxID=3077585 RepID=UPI0028F01C6B|nr:hypothetical protein [Bacillus sp. DTU_2020_1000418_1_SI_GHA_SEK_038]WNS76100.1 hypothetical protein RRV45_03555 [Bacillus sp. DTU_2020_1000418_1_SI_GHA_SEK_038]
MFKAQKEYYWKIGLLVSFISFILLITAVGKVLDSELNIKNLAAFIGFSLAVGLIALLLVRFGFKVALIFFLVGLIIGFIEMYRLFFSDSSGWGDLAGLISLFMWVFMGIGLGVFAQLGAYYWRKRK